MDTLKFGQFIAERRRELGLKQQELAEKLNVTDKAVSRWENGRGFPDINTLEPLAEALGVSVVELMKSERLEEPLTPETADTALADTIKIADMQTKQKRVMAVVTVLAVIVAVVVIPFFSWQIWAYNNPIVSFSYGIPYRRGFRSDQWLPSATVFPLKYYSDGKLDLELVNQTAWKYYRDGEWFDIEPGMENWYIGVDETIRSRSLFGMSKTWKLRQAEISVNVNEYYEDIMSHQNDKPYLFLSYAENDDGCIHYTYIGYYTVDGEAVPYYRSFYFGFNANARFENISEEYFNIIWEKIPDLKEAFETHADPAIWMAKYLNYGQGNNILTDWVPVTIENGTTAIWYVNDKSEHIRS